MVITSGFDIQNIDIDKQLKVSKDQLEVAKNKHNTSQLDKSMTQPSLPDANFYHTRKYSIYWIHYV